MASYSHILLICYDRLLLRFFHIVNTIANIERHKTQLVAKGFTLKNGIDYKETFSPVSKKVTLFCLRSTRAL